MSLQFLGQKSWHPANKANQKRIWIAEEKAREKEKSEKEKQKELCQTAEELTVQQVAAGDIHAAQRLAARERVTFLYTVPPGLDETTKVGHLPKRIIVEEDDAVQEFRRKVATYSESQCKLERYVGRKAEAKVTVKDQVERFPMLKNAPVEGKYTETIQVRFNPVGVRLRNVRCVRCSEWGHQSGDRECKLRDRNPNDVSRLRWEDPVTEIKKLQSKLMIRKGALPLEMQESGGNEEFEILQSDDDDEEDALISMKRKRRVMKKKKRKKKSSCSNGSDSDSSDCRYRLKKKRQQKHKHHGRNRSNDEKKKTASQRRDPPRQSRNYVDIRHPCVSKP